MKTYDHVARAVFGTPWYTTPDHLATIAGIVGSRMAGAMPTPEELAARLAEAQTTAGPRGGARTMGAVAVIPVYGTLMARANLFTEFSGGATYQSIGRALREALADDSIGSIVFDIDSPGGEVIGCDELASEIRAARGRKPMVAVASGMMASAAYYLGCQADEVVASPSSVVGSVGCVTVQWEESRALDEAGITVNVIRNPVAKYEGNPYEPLSDEARAHLQERTDDYADAFRASVAKARGVPVSAVKAGYGQGRSLGAKRALEAKLVDRIATLDETIVRLATGKGPVSKGTAAEEPETLTELADAMGDDVNVDETPLLRSDQTTEAQAALALARARAGKR